MKTSGLAITVRDYGVPAGESGDVASGRVNVIVTTDADHLGPFGKSLAAAVEKHVREAVAKHMAKFENVNRDGERYRPISIQKIGAKSK